MAWGAATVVLVSPLAGGAGARAGRDDAQPLVDRLRVHAVAPRYVGKCDSAEPGRSRDLLQRRALRVPHERRRDSVVQQRRGRGAGDAHARRPGRGRQRLRRRDDDVLRVGRCDADAVVGQGGHDPDDRRLSTLFAAAGDSGLRCASTTSTSAPVGHRPARRRAPRDAAVPRAHAGRRGAVGAHGREAANGGAGPARVVDAVGRRVDVARAPGAVLAPAPRRASTAGYDTCARTSVPDGGAGPFATLAPQFLCSDVVPAGTNSVRVHGLEDGKAYEIAVIAIGIDGIAERAVGGGARDARARRWASRTSTGRTAARRSRAAPSPRAVMGRAPSRARSCALVAALGARARARRRGALVLVVAGLSRSLVLAARRAPTARPAVLARRASTTRPPSASPRSRGNPSSSASAPTDPTSTESSRRVASRAARTSSSSAARAGS